MLELPRHPNTTTTSTVWTSVTVSKFNYKQVKQLPTCRALWGSKYCKNGVLCVGRCVATRRFGLRPSLTNRTLGHRGHWIHSCPDSSVGRASVLKAEGPGFNSQLGWCFWSYKPTIGIQYSQNSEEQAWLISGQIWHISWVLRIHKILKI